MTKKLILDKVQWARGGEPVTRLLDRKGRMCCLGFLMGQEGVSTKTLIDEGEPAEAMNSLADDNCPPYLCTKEDADVDGSQYDYCVQYSDTDFTATAMGINDDPNTDDAGRVEALNRLFSSVGVEVVLVSTPEERAALGGLPVGFGMGV